MACSSLRPLRIVALAFASALAGAGCPSGDGDGLDGPGSGEWVPAGEAQVGPEGGVVQSDDGALQASFPEGAFAAATTVRVARWDPDASGSASTRALALREDVYVDDVLPIAGTRYRLEPVGLEAQVPFLVSVRFGLDAVPVPVEAEDLGLYQEGASAWSPVPDPFVDGLGPAGTSSPRAGGMATTLGAFQVALHPPYAEPPALDGMVVGGTVVADRTGPLQETGHGGLVDLVGSGFGWDESVVEVLVDGQPVETSGVTNRRIAAYPHWGPDPPYAKNRSVVVKVDGRPSNTLTFRVEGATACEGLIEEIWPTGAAPGMTVRLEGTLCGTEETRRVLLGDTPLVPTDIGGGAYSVTIPEGTAPGWTTLRPLDGVGSDPGPPVDLMVLPTGPIGLSPGLEADGVRFVAAHGAGQDHYLVLDVTNLEPYRVGWDGNSQVQGKLEVRYETPHEDTGFHNVLPSDHDVPGCWGLPSGPCVLPVASALIEGLPEGAQLTITLRMTQKVLQEDAPEGRYVRESDPLTLDVESRAPLGSFDQVNLGHDDGTRAFCSPYTKAFAVGDHVCLYAHGPGDEAETDPCLAGVHRISAPDLFEGTLDFSGCWLRDKCFPLDAAGTYTLQNQTLGRTCELEVSHAPGSGSSTTYFDPAEGTLLAAGGARIDIQPGALPPTPDGEPYRLEAWSMDDAAASETDPQREWDVTFGFRLEPDVSRLLAPVSITMPYEPAPAAPELGLIDAATGFTHLVEEGVSQLADALRWDLPAGEYTAEEPAAGAPEPVMPASFNVVVNKVGVVHRRESPGVIEDLEGRVRVEYVVDPNSDDFVDDLYAATVLDAAVDAYEALEGLDWRLPDETIRILVRESVSWADFSGQASGATSSGFLGQPVSVIRSTLGTLDEVTYVTIHEMGHVFQREYTTNLTLAWLDEAMSEWIAWKVLGDAFPQAGLTEAAAAAEVPTLGLPNGWGGYPSGLVYGTSPWLMWISHAHGDAAVRGLYEALDGEPLNWASVHATFEEALGKSAFLAAGEFAEDFWAQRFPPLEDLHLSALLATAGIPATAAFTQASSLDVPLLPRPPLSSLRYRVRVPAAVEQEALTGDLVLRAGDLDPFQRLVVLHQPSLAGELSDAVPVTVLDDDTPLAILPGLVAGTYWIIDNHRATSGTSSATLRMELPRVTGISPSPAATGNQVTISGAALGEAPGTLNVGGQKVTPKSWSATSVTFQMPDFPNTSSVMVVVRTREDARANDLFLPVAQP
ncbi:MAG: IPT/TIG domain-containing protein [Myxococcota bacterium]